MSFVRALRDETCSTMTTTPTSLTCASILTRHPSISPLGFSGLTANPLSSSGSSSSREANNGKGLPSSGVAKPKQAASKQPPSALTFPFDPVPHIRNGPCFVQGVNDVTSSADGVTMTEKRRDFYVLRVSLLLLLSLTHVTDFRVRTQGLCRRICLSVGKCKCLVLDSVIRACDRTMNKIRTSASFFASLFACVFYSDRGITTGNSTSSFPNISTNTARTSSSTD
jgi:hypothetical protein